MRSLAALLLPMVLAVAAAHAKEPPRASAAYVETVRAAVDSHLEELPACVDPKRQKKGTSEVRVDVQLTILSDGAVLSAQRGANKPRADAEIERCMLAKVKTWRFPAPPDHQTVSVSFPIVLVLEK